MDDPKFLQARTAPGGIRTCAQGKQLADVSEQQRRWGGRILVWIWLFQRRRPQSALVPDWNLYIRLFGELPGFFVAGIYVPDDAHPRIGSQHAFDAPGHHVGTVGNRDLTGV